MDRRTKVKLMTTVICLSLSIFALFTFWFSAALSLGWQIVLTIVALFWIISGISNLAEIFRRK